jgi:hypothetical protein
MLLTTRLPAVLAALHVSIGALPAISRICLRTFLVLVMSEVLGYSDSCDNIELVKEEGEIL